MLKFINKFKERLLRYEVEAVMKPLIDHFRSYLPAEETRDNFDYYMFEALLAVFGGNSGNSSNNQIVSIAKSYLKCFNTQGSSNTIRMAVKFLVFTVKNLRLVQQESIHKHNLSYYFYNITSETQLIKIQNYIEKHAEQDDRVAKFLCPLSKKPIKMPVALRYDVTHHISHPLYEYSLYELSELHDLIFFQAIDTNPITSKYMGSSNLFLGIKELRDIFNMDIEELKKHALK